jgi:BirA family biotin operon repressor/biotin-[acetyl-CoA-carboxylase] ligase
MTIDHGLFFLSAGLEGAAEPLDADSLAAAHPLWADAAGRMRTAQDAGHGMLQANGTPGASRVVVCGACTSSMDVAWRLAADGLLPSWGAVAAVSQHQGRGRLRRPWSSPPGNLYAAIRLPDMPSEWRDVSSLFCGFFAAEALAGLGLAVTVKWPNDLMIQGRKVGGILVEERREECVAGIGINIAGALPGFKPRELWSPKPAWLPASTASEGPLGVLSALVKSGQHCYDEFVAHGPPERFMPVLEKRLDLLHQKVIVHGTAPEEPAYAAQILGLLPDGALLIDCEGKRVALRSGSIAPA